MKLRADAVTGIVIFIILLFASFSKEADAAPTLALGMTAFNSTLPTADLGIRWHDKYEVNATVIGAGWTEKGEQLRTHIVSASRIVRPTDHYFMRIGLAHVSKNPLVGHGNYRLGFGFRGKQWELEYFHFSSAGINSTNRGIDGITARVLF